MSSKKDAGRKGAAVDKSAKDNATPMGEGEQGAPVKKKMSGKTLILFIVLPAVLAVGGGAAAAVMLMAGGSATAAKTEVAGEAARETPKEEEAKPAPGGEGAKKGGEASGEKAGEGEAKDIGYAIACSGTDPCYYVMPKLIVNLAGPPTQRSAYMELELTLEASSTQTFHRVPEIMPRLKDQLNAFLRELRVEDLSGSTGTWRLRRELLTRFNTLLDPQKIDAVLVESMLIQ